jgi:hypothetical protein
MTELLATGPLEEVVQTMELLAWLIAMLRIPKDDGITMSSVNFQKIRSGFQDNLSNSTLGHYRLSL